MTRLISSSALLGDQRSEGITVGAGGGTYDTSSARIGNGSFRYNVNGTTYQDDFPFTGVLGRNYYARGYIYVAQAPSLNALLLQIATTQQTNYAAARLNPAMNFSLESSGGTTNGGVTLDLNTLYRIELRALVGTGAVDECELRIYLGHSTTVLETIGPRLSQSIGDAAFLMLRIGLDNFLTSDINIGNVALNDDQGSNQNTWPGPGQLAALRPNGSGTAGTNEGNWTKPGGATTQKETAVDNIPPVYLADSTIAGDAEKMLRNATNAASDLTLTTAAYNTAGIGDSDLITLVQPVAMTGSASATDTSGTLEMTSNPVVSQSAITAFDNGVASATTTTWVRQAGNMVHFPDVTRNVSPQIRLSRAATANTVMTNALAVLVETIPATAGSATRYQALKLRPTRY